MKKKQKRLLLTAVGVLVAVSLAACSSEGGKQEEEGTGGGTGAGTADTPRVKIAMITHEAPGDTFWDLIRKGAEAAAAKDNVELIYSNDPQAPKQAELIQSAIDSEVDAICRLLRRECRWSDESLSRLVEEVLALGKTACAAGRQLVGSQGGGVITHARRLVGAVLLLVERADQRRVMRVSGRKRGDAVRPGAAAILFEIPVREAYFLEKGVDLVVGVEKTPIYEPRIPVDHHAAEVEDDRCDQ